MWSRRASLPATCAPCCATSRRLADALGARRDPDVQLAAVAAFARGAGDPEQADEVVSDAIRAGQSAGNEQLAAALAQVRGASDLRGRLLALADAAAEQGAGRIKRDVKGLDPSGRLADNVERIARTRLDELFALARGPRSAR